MTDTAIATPPATEIERDAPQKPGDVISRNLVSEGLIVCSIKPPKQTRKQTAPDGTPYEQFGIQVKDGWINFHLFDRENCFRRGNCLHVEVHVFQKETRDGRKFTYVDLHPAPDGVRPTHERKVFRTPFEAPEEFPADTRTFETAGEVNGLLAFIPIVRDEETGEE